MNNAIELIKCNFSNKGDHLMAIAIMDNLSAHFPQIDFCVPLGGSNAELRKRHSFNQSLRIAPGVNRQNYLRNNYRNIIFSSRNIAPQFILNKIGYVKSGQIKAVFDVGGYSFSDFWPVKGRNPLIDYYKECRKRGQFIVLMPKTFGPFSNIKVINDVKETFDLVDLVFCRDRISADFLVEIGIKQSSFFPATDYTISVPGITPEYAESYKNRPVIIPNYRMFDKTNANVSASYVNFLKYIYNYFEKIGAKPFFLLHDKISDMPVIEMIERDKELSPDLLVEDDPLYIKGIIGQSSHVVSSRLHGIINGLSQGIPTIGLGWSHKYPTIFEDFESSDLFIRDINDVDDINKKLQLITEESSRKNIQDRLMIAKQKLIKTNDEMWDLICNKLADKLR